MRDAWLAHLALSDIDGGRFLHAERLNRSGPGLAGASLEQARVWNGNWQVQWDLRAGTQRMEAMRSALLVPTAICGRRSRR